MSIVTLHSLPVAVSRPRPIAGSVDAAVMATRYDVDGIPTLALVTRHADGDMLSAFLTEADVNDLADQIAAFIESLPREVRAS